MEINIKIPTYDECEQKAELKETLSPLENFIYENEPSFTDEEWRDSLKECLEYVISSYIK